MNATKYRIPDMNLYLRPEGLFTPTIEPDDEVLELTIKHARVLEVIYYGQVLQQMISLKDSGSDAVV